MTELLLLGIGCLALLSAAQFWALGALRAELGELRSSVTKIRIPPPPDVSDLALIKRQVSVLLEIASAEPPPAENAAAPESESQEALEAMSRRVALLVPMVRALYDRANAPTPKYVPPPPAAPREKPGRAVLQAVREAQKARGHN
jgi:hypothetical protein